MRWNSRKSTQHPYSEESGTAMSEWMNLFHAFMKIFS